MRILFLSLVVCFGMTQAGTLSLGDYGSGKRHRSGLTYYGTHLVTDLASRVAFFTSFVIGLAVASRSPQVDDTTGDACKGMDGGALGVIPIALGTLLGLYLYHKAPQWTDMYILRNGIEHNAPVGEFLLRTILPYPCGSLFTALEAKLDYEAGRDMR